MTAAAGFWWLSLICATIRMVRLRAYILARVGRSRTPIGRFGAGRFGKHAVRDRGTVRRQRKRDAGFRAKMSCAGRWQPASGGGVKQRDDGMDRRADYSGRDDVNRPFRNQTTPSAVDRAVHGTTSTVPGWRQPCSNAYTVHPGRQTQTRPLLPAQTSRPNCPAGSEAADLGSARRRRR